MKHFFYRLQTPEGRTSRGVIGAHDEQTARERLTARGEVLLSLRVLPFSMTSIAWPGGRGPVHHVIKQLALMVGASLPLRESLSLVMKQPASLRWQRILEDLYRQVCQGIPLSRAMAQHPRSFDPLCCAVIEAGEWSGNLATALNHYADHLDEQRQLRNALRQALSYPLLLLSVSFVVIGILLTVAVPKIVSQLSLSGVALPWSTRLVLWLGESLRSGGPYLLLLLLVLTFVIKRQMRRGENRRRCHRLWLRLPALGALIRRTQQVRLLMTLSILCATSVPMADALRLASGALNNLWLRSKVLNAVQTLVEGAAFTQALEREALLPDDLLALLQAGEQGGSLSEVLRYLAVRQREQLQQRLLAMVKLLEPLLIFTLGLVVLLVFMAIIQPMLTMNTLSF
ncbi:type II secretion system F family protein [Ewingella americana]|uniref:type II secretion system F family protein n=1 Tax=Ewingella americana TaxID=41202 RepID=UPI0012AEA722|nr:type II secretion system F family protein [Ewingella americana]MRT05931.1 hypothetical protein [Ewingella americana]